MRISPLWTLRLTELPEFDCSGSLEAEGQSFLHEVPGQPVICPPRPDPEFITHLSLWIAQALLRCDFFVLFLGGITEDFGWLGFFHHLLFERNMDSHSWVLAFFPPRNWQTNLKIPYQIQIFWTNEKTLWSPWIFLCVGASKFSHLQMLKKKSSLFVFDEHYLWTYIHKEAPWNSAANFISLPLWAFKMHVSIFKIPRSLEIWHVINFIYFGFPEFIWIPQLLVHLPWPSLHPQILIKWDSECLLYTLPVLLFLVWLFYIWSWRTDHESSDSVVSKDGVAALL